MTAAIALAGCRTGVDDVHAMDAGPSAVRLGTFESIALVPTAVETDGANRKVVGRLDQLLRACLSDVFPSLTVAAASAPGRGLLIEPAVLNLAKANVAERITTGPVVGGSNVALRVRFRGAAGEVIAEPSFTAAVTAWRGFTTFGAADNLMLSRITGEACNYARRNR